MQGLPPIPLNTMLWLSLGMFGLSVLMGVPMWFRNWRVRRGAQIPVTAGDIDYQTVARWLALMSIFGVLSSALIAASRALPFAGFMVLCAVGTALMIFVAYRIDVARARRH